MALNPMNYKNKNMKEFMFQKELALIKQLYEWNVCFVITGILKMLLKNLNHSFALNCMMY